MSDADLTRRSLRQTLNRHTAARLLLDRTGDTVSTQEQLAFQLDHALARDAVHSSLDVFALQAQLAQRHIHSIAVESAAESRETYLRRSDLGRTLSGRSRDFIAAQPPSADLLIILADGLSALAVERHAPPLLDELSAKPATVVIATQARVALGDEIGYILGAQLTVMLIGERPGLSAPDSLGAYLTWSPRPGRTDAERNCISNIRQGGLDYADAAERILAYVSEARRLAYTGVNLKEPQGHVVADGPATRGAVTS